MAAAALVFYVKIHVKPECVDQWKREVEAVIEQMSREETFVSCYLHQDAQDPYLFTLYERWNEPSVEAFLRNQTKPYREEYDARLPALLQRPREPAVLLPLAEWHKRSA
jgi:quinol monooxygenase YgiN